MDDLSAGSFLKNLAILEIRAMARRAKPLEFWPDDDYTACIAWLADLCHNMPDLSRRAGGVHGVLRLRRDQGRPFRHAWQAADSLGRHWIVDRLKREGLAWDPPA
ncbi:hypothetical protein [Actinoplanes sp. GCM10030250]|uniref:hypothetical protein n=1 Tax=Actinoplanes sp. GCM10030250 TaxID=3273376 RepID=UPI00360E661E